MARRDRTEFGAIPIVAVVIGYGALVFLAATEGVWAWILLGVATIGVAALVVWWVARRHRHPIAPPPPTRTAHTDDGVHRILVIADDECVSTGFREQVLRLASGRRTEAFVVAPALGSRLARWTGDEGAYQDAEQHLNATVEALTREGVRARGHIGPHDPVQAADDGLREFPADEIVFATHPGSSVNWLEEGVVETARSRYDIPVTHIVVESTG
jgi:GABA permease